MDTRVAPRWIVAALACLVLCPPAARAQSAIAGVVKDASGAVMPGVTVEAASPELIEKARSVVTDERGAYQIRELRPGTYAVTFSLTGFSTVKRDDIRLPTDFTATVNAEMKVGGLEETVTVSGASPVVDVQSATKAQVMTRELMRSNRRTAVLRPARAGRDQRAPDVGGACHEPVAMNCTATPDRDHRMLDGIQLNGMCGNGSTQAYTNTQSYEEMVFQTTSAGADVSAGGIRQNMVPRQGGNDFHGSFHSYGSASSWQGANITPDLIARGLTKGDKLDGLYDVEGGAGGKIVTDRLWWLIAPGKITANTAVADVLSRREPGRQRSVRGECLRAVDGPAQPAQQNYRLHRPGQQVRGPRHAGGLRSGQGVARLAAFETLPAVASQVDVHRQQSAVGRCGLRRVSRAAPYDVSARDRASVRHAGLVCRGVPSGHVARHGDQCCAWRRLLPDPRPPLLLELGVVRERRALDEVRRAGHVGIPGAGDRSECGPGPDLPEHCAVHGVDLQHAGAGSVRHERAVGTLCAGRVDAEAFDDQLRRALGVLPLVDRSRVLDSGPVRAGTRLRTGRHADLEDVVAAARDRVRPVRDRKDGAQVQRQQVPAVGDQRRGGRAQPDAAPVGVGHVAGSERRRHRQGSLGCAFGAARGELRAGAEELRPHHAGLLDDATSDRFRAAPRRSTRTSSVRTTSPTTSGSSTSCCRACP